MYSVYQHWDPLKTCVVGRSYPPEFYSWMKNPKTRSIFERIAQETEEDYQLLIALLEKFGVEVLRPDIPAEVTASPNGPSTKSYPPPPMAPRDYMGMYGSDFYFGRDNARIEDYYNNKKDTSWPDGVKTIGDIKNLPIRIQDEISARLRNHINTDTMADDEAFVVKNHNGDFNTVLNKIAKNTTSANFIQGQMLSTATTVRIGKDIYCSDINAKQECDKKPEIFEKYRMHYLNMDVHTDGVFCPVVPGLIISLNDIPTYKDTFPDWEVVYLPDQSWSKVQPFLDLKHKNNGKWWIPGEEYNDDVIETVNTWMSKWVGYVEETVFDVNILVINEKNVIVNNYNKQVFDALERYGVTPHICNFRHRYFWDGGLHCITADLDREGEMKDYFPERG
jgi:N-dimethylarginine dimethylaminohydrolase